VMVRVSIEQLSMRTERRSPMSSTSCMVPNPSFHRPCAKSRAVR
jgi:hypothetical protein